MPLFDVTAVKPLEGRRIYLCFEDGLEGAMCLDDLVSSYHGVFAPLQDESFFRQVVVDEELGTVVWPNGADICPTVLYERILALQGH
ncbi:MAG: DUF2442 domain-containing protein [Methylococcaceae bacterium]